MALGVLVNPPSAWLGSGARGGGHARTPPDPIRFWLSPQHASTPRARAAAAPRQARAHTAHAHLAEVLVKDCDDSSRFTASHIDTPYFDSAFERWLEHKVGVKVYRLER